MSSERYVPRPIDTSDVVLPPELLALAETLAHNTHEVWAQQKKAEGKQAHPSYVPYDELPESEKDYDRRTSQEALKVIVKLGFTITPPR